MVIRLLRSLRRYRIISPLIGWGKRFFYTPYVRRNLKAGDFPREVWIENTNHCNASCVMCPRDSMTRPKGVMDFKLFEKIIREVAIYKDKVERVHLHNYGEPLLDKQLSKRIRLAKDLGIRHVYFVTNASLLTENVSKEIIEAGLDEFKVSFYGTDSENYNATMRGLDFDKALSNIKNFFRIRNKLNSVTPAVVLQYLPVDNDTSQFAQFSSMFTPLIHEENGDRLNLFALHNYGGGKGYVPLGRIENICHYPWDTFLILQDGSVASCCFDYNGIQILGNVNRNSIAEIWNSEKYIKMREDFKKLNYKAYPACLKCSVIRSKR